MIRTLALVPVLVAVMGASALAAEPAVQTSIAPGQRVSPHSAEGAAILAQIKKLDQRIRFQERLASERRARELSANRLGFFYPGLSSAYGGYGGGYSYSGYGGYSGGSYYQPAYSRGGGYSTYYSPGLGFGFYNPAFNTSIAGPDRGTVKYRRLVRERQALRAMLDDSLFPSS